MNYQVNQLQQRPFIQLKFAKSRDNFIGTEVSYNFVNVDNRAFPTLGIHTDLTLGFKTNIDESNSYGYIIPSIAFDYKLIHSGQLVLATKLKGHVNIGDGFESELESVQA